MRNIKTLATLFLRVFAVSYFFSGMIDVAMLIFDYVFVRTGMYLRSEVAFTPRVMAAGFDIVVAAFFFYQSKELIEFVTRGLDTSEESETELEPAQGDASG